MAKVFGEAFLSPTRLNECTVSFTDQQGVSIQIVKWHPLLDLYVNVFKVHTKDDTSGFVGRKALKLLESGTKSYGIDISLSTSFQEWLLQQIISNSELDHNNEEKVVDSNPEHTAIKRSERERSDHIKQVNNNLDCKTVTTHSTKRHTNSNLMHGFIRHKKKKTGKLVYQKL